VGIVISQVVEFDGVPLAVLVERPAGERFPLPPLLIGDCPAFRLPSRPFARNVGTGA
jgi:hypothetical protein